PYVSETTNGNYKHNYVSEQNAFYQNGASKIATDANPFAITIYEPSPLGRIKEQGNFGSAWQPGTNTQRVNFSVNTQADQVRKFNEDGTSFSFYPSNILHKQIVYNENGSQTILFSDNTGKLLLKKQQLDENIQGSQVTFLDTYYIYDDFFR